MFLRDGVITFKSLVDNLLAPNNQKYIACVSHFRFPNVMFSF